MFLISQIYAWFYVIVKRLFGYQMRGLGFLLRRVNASRMFEISGRKMWFNPKVASSYGLLISGIWQEPETHSVLSHIIDGLRGRPVAFVDVGANVGEMIIDVGRHRNVVIHGFDPSKECCRVIERSLQANGDTNYRIYDKLVGDTIGQVPFDEGVDINAASVLSTNSALSSRYVEQTTLDNELALPQENVILLVDVEGYEPQVLRGGVNLISQKRPLVVFEYNSVSKRHFRIGDIQSVLGSDYHLYRLRSDAQLDADVENAWNCVAIPDASIFEGILDDRIMP